MKAKEECEKVGLKLSIQNTKIMAPGPITLWQRWGNNGNWQILLLLLFWLQNHCRWWLQPWNSKMLAPWKESYNTPRQHIKKQRHLSANKSPYSQIYGFPITSWCLGGEIMETVTDFVSLGSKITVDGDYSHEIKRFFAPWREAMTYLDSILKSRDITLPTKVHIVNAMIFPKVMYRCECWTIRKAEPQRTDAFKLWC